MVGSSLLPVSLVLATGDLEQLFHVVVRLLDIVWAFGSRKVFDDIAFKKPAKLLWRHPSLHGCPGLNSQVFVVVTADLSIICPHGHLVGCWLAQSSRQDCSSAQLLGLVFRASPIPRL